MSKKKKRTKSQVNNKKKQNKQNHASQVNTKNIAAQETEDKAENEEETSSAENSVICEAENVNEANTNESKVDEKKSDNEGTNEVKTGESTKKKNKILAVFQLPVIEFSVLAIVLNLVLETLSRHSLVKAFHFAAGSPSVFFYNAFIIFVTLSLVLFAKRKIFATVFVCAMWIASAFANWIVLCFRTTPFSAIDILMFRNVMTMIDKYMNKWQMVLSAIGILLAIILLVYLYIRLPKSPKKRHPLRASAYVCMCAFLIVNVTRVAVENQTVSDNFGNLAYAYNDYGFAYCFSNSIIDVGISKPVTYSEETIKAIVDPLDYDKTVVDFTIAQKIAMEKQELNNNADNQEVAEDATTNEAVDENSTAEDEQDDGEDQNTQEENVDQSEESVEASEDENIENENDEEGDLEEQDEEEIPRFSEEDIKNPNIIVIQLESVFDTKYMKNFYTSENPMPYLAQLKRKYSSGLFTVPAVGAGTANTEFEVQTGMSTQFFGAGEYPFKTVMKTVSCDSMAYDLKRQGYATTGFHNNDATFYERYIDYSNLGFDYFSGMEHMWNLCYTPRGWGKDNVLAGLMVEQMQQTPQRDYITTITVQCHGRYPKKHTKTLTNIDCFFTGQYATEKEKQAAWEYYVNMCRECDNMVRNLIRKLEKIDEPTVVFMYGDHLPSLDLQEEDLRDISLYQTEWVMWDNFGLGNEKRNLKSYQASTYIFNRLGLKGGLMQNFHNRYMYSVNQEDYLDKLELLEYDTLYGKNYAFNGRNVFPKTDMKMGIRDIVLKDYEIKNERVWIHGENFNEFSKVHVDGQEVETLYINNDVIIIDEKDLKDKSLLSVVQVGDDHIVLSESNSISISQVVDSTQKQ